MHYGTEMNASQFGVKDSKVKGQGHVGIKYAGNSTSGLVNTNYTMS